MTTRLSHALFAALALAGCTSSPTPSPPSIPRPTAGTPSAASTPTPIVTAAAIPAPHEIVLRMTVTEFPSPATLVEPPDFNLYADGHLIYVQKLGQDSFEMREARLQPDVVSALLADAEAVLGGARDRYDYFDNLHSWSTTFDLRSPTLSKTVSIYALEVPNVDPPSEADRALLRPLQSRLLLIDMDVRANDSYIGPYEPEAYLVELIDSADELPDKIAWPWPALMVDDFAPTDPRARERVMSRAELQDVLPFAGGSYLIAPAPDGNRYVIRLTPLLPDDPRHKSVE